MRSLLLQRGINGDFCEGRQCGLPRQDAGVREVVAHCGVVYAGAGVGTGVDDSDSVFMLAETRGLSQSRAVHLDEESLANDLTPQKDKPLWPLSTFGPAKHEPNLLAGLDTSPEELRYQALVSKREGKLELYNARNNLNQAYQTALNQCASLVAQAGAATGTVANAPSSSTSIFGAPAPASAFGQTAFSNTSTSAFSKPAPAAPAFGQPSAPGPAFGQPSAFGQPATTQPASAFSTNAPQQQPQTTSAFGQPPAFGQSAFGHAAPSSVIKPATGAFGGGGGSGGGGAFSAFAGQPSAFGASAVTSVFGQGIFGAPAPAPASSAFGSSAPATSAFGAPATSAFGTPLPAASAFGNANPNPAPAASAFGSNTAPAPSVFGAPSAFGNPAPALAPPTAPTPFGAAPTTTTNAPPPPPSASPMQQSTSQPPLSAFPMASPSTSFSAFSSSPGFGSAPVPGSAPAPGFGSTTVPGSTTGPGSSSGPAPAPGPGPGPAKADSKPDFAHARSLYQKGATPYDALLPPDYALRLPEGARRAFERARFEWGDVPEWTPPLEVR
ncbi:hypothetical protein C0993_004606 [Termitomyces sp. T159_Od127]|nr:hypothetical protein C0993_004606 [Termitomyces sp. T159_Od127]